MKRLNELSLENKRVFIRVDFNVPLTADNQVADDGRIRACLPTIQYVLKRKGSVILASHLGRPNGERNLKYSLAPVAERLMSLLQLPQVVFPEDCVGDGIAKLSKNLKSGQVMLLENLRFHKEEEANEAHFAKKLAALADVYINDAFGASHRAHASIVAMAALIQEKGIGFLMQKEVEFLSSIIKNPKRPFFALLGGAKVSDKIGVMEKLLNTVDQLAIGGAMAYTFLKALGKKVGNSKVETEKIRVAAKILNRAEVKGIPILLPLDHRIAKELKEDAELQTTETAEIPEGWIGVDIGPKTIEAFTQPMQKSKTAFWNGPMGIYEIEKFAQGTYSIARAMGNLRAVTIVGGGDSASAVRQAGLEEKITHLSTGGGASLEFIEQGTLPGLKVLGYS